MTAPSPSNPESRPVLVLDFDGTVCLGDGPVWAYADGVLPHLAPDLALEIRGALTAYLAGHDHTNAFADGYSAIADLAGPYVPSAVLAEAYASSRLALESADVDISAPAGLAELLDTVAASVRTVVVTNAPNTGLDTALKRLGLVAQIDQVISSADKPAGSSAVFEGLLAGAAPANLMSVGDFWVNDIEPALSLGSATAFIDRGGRDLRPAHVRARAIQDLYPAIEAWARSPQSFVDSHSPAPAPSTPTPDRSTP